MKMKILTSLLLIAVLLWVGIKAKLILENVDQINLLGLQDNFMIIKLHVFQHGDWKVPFKLIQLKFGIWMEKMKLIKKINNKSLNNEINDSNKLDLSIIQIIFLL